MLTFRVHGLPQTKGSTKAFYRPGMKYPVITNDNVQNKGWAATVAGEAQRVRRAYQLAAPLEGPIRLELEFYLRKPKSYPKSKKLPAIKKPDLDKMIRSVKDALKGVLYGDDAQVVCLQASKQYDDSPGVQIRVGGIVCN